ncbi:MAG: bifunctional phosphoglucose/phosphomannose isomerase [bacterium]|nr:bifunctional phosphoglucose/phosphomannose isomerase [bacterium]
MIKIKEFDKSNLFDILKNFSKIWEHANEIGRKFEIDNKYFKEIEKIVICGMGGSAIGGDIIREYAETNSSIPVFVDRNYILPKYVNNKTLLIMISYSGNTEETLSVFREAGRTGAKMIGLSSDGKLSEFCNREKVPFVLIPSGYSPRAILPYLFLPILIILEKLKIIPDQSGPVKEVFDVLNEMSGELSVADKNKALDLAKKCRGGVPIICSSQNFSSLALRWKTQINENSKAPAYAQFFPELNHNEIVGWEGNTIIDKKFEFIFLKTALEHPRINLRMEITKDILKQKNLYANEISGRGRELLSQMVSIIYFGDWVSFYLAILNEVDPSPVKIITFLKNELGKVAL